MNKAYRRRAIFQGLAGMACLAVCLILPGIVEILFTI